MFYRDILLFTELGTHKALRTDLNLAYDQLSSHCTVSLTMAFVMLSGTIDNFFDKHGSHSLKIFREGVGQLKELQ